MKEEGSARGKNQEPENQCEARFWAGRLWAALRWPEATPMDGPEGRFPCVWMLRKEPVGSLSKIEEVARSATPRKPLRG